MTKFERLMCTLHTKSSNEKFKIDHIKNLCDI